MLFTPGHFKEHHLDSELVTNYIPLYSACLVLTEVCKTALVIPVAWNTIPMIQYRSHNLIFFPTTDGRKDEVKQC